MIAWATIDAAVKAAIVAASGVQDVQWHWQPGAMRALVSIDLKRSPVARLGTDDRSYDYDAIAGTLTATQRGQRSFVVEVRCTSDRGEPSDTTPVDAADVLAQLMTRMWRQSNLNALATAGCALSSIGQIVRQDFAVDGRDYGLAIVPITFLCADVDADTTEDWIDHFAGELVVTTPDGTVIRTPFSG